MPPSLYRDTEPEIGRCPNPECHRRFERKVFAGSGGGGVGGRVPKEEECEIGLGGGEVERREQVLLR